MLGVSEQDERRRVQFGGADAFGEEGTSTDMVPLMHDMRMPTRNREHGEAEARQDATAYHADLMREEQEAISEMKRVRDYSHVHGGDEGDGYVPPHLQNQFNDSYGDMQNDLNESLRDPAAKGEQEDFSQETAKFAAGMAFRSKAKDDWD